MPHEKEKFKVEIKFRNEFVGLDSACQAEVILAGEEHCLGMWRSRMDMLLSSWCQMAKDSSAEKKTESEESKEL